MIPEQDWEGSGVPASPHGTDPATASIGFTGGQGTGSAGEITWAEAQYTRLARDIGSVTAVTAGPDGISRRACPARRDLDDHGRDRHRRGRHRPTAGDGHRPGPPAATGSQPRRAWGLYQAAWWSLRHGVRRAHGRSVG